MPLFSDKPEIFRDKAQLDTDTPPEEFPGREKTIGEYKKALYPIYKGEKPKNLFIYGEPGTGKTSMTKYVLQHLANDTDDPIHPVYVNCKSIDNSYQLARDITNNIREQRHGHNHKTLSSKGYSKADIFEYLFEEIDSTDGTIIIIIDEIDNVSDIEDLLYEIPRAHNTERIDSNTNLPGIIGISNRTDYLSDVSSKIKDTLNDVTIQFGTYNVNDLKKILNSRADKAFYKDVLDDELIPLCAARAYGTGSARRALDLLRTAGEIARNNNDQVVTKVHLQEAEDQLDRNYIRDFLQATDDQTRWALLAVLVKECAGTTPARTSNLYNEYKQTIRGSSRLSHDRFRGRLNKLADHEIVICETKNDNGKYSQYQLNNDLKTSISAFPDEYPHRKPLRDLLDTARKNNALPDETIDELQGDLSDLDEIKSE